ncbi:Nitrate reductase, gamma subunit [Desulfitobacterium hafniense]|uniref:Nitrate reductase, gamma subunit n=1 Tax=Desulfitobacterium hafniense TaxID=49338 RepID=A0A098B7F5_DESHA|nr:respiratory nitrate reductase subunit gamma [Desulfitobacterium hafniense]CDX04784.1 Nitrate reductase, gamma subunit [Desulfitobacterium hafniense]
MNVFFGWVVPYIIFAIFLSGIVNRMLVWSHVPVPFKLTVFFGPQTMRGACADLAKETIGFRSLWRGKKGLWFISWLFHISLASILIGHIVGIAFLGQQFTKFGVSAEQSESLSVMLGTYAGVAFLMGVMLLFIRRVASKKMRFISNFGDYLVLVLLLGIAGSGMYMRSLDNVTYLEVATYLKGLISLNPVPPPSSVAFLLHFNLVQLLLLYFPSSKLMHSCGIFFTRWLITRPYERQVIINEHTSSDSFRSKRHKAPEPISNSDREAS